MEVYNIKAKRCGNIIKIHKYKNGILRGYKTKSSSTILRTRNLNTPESIERRKNNLTRLRSNFIDLINHNFTNKDLFITLTYEKDVEHVEVKKDFDKFIKKLKYRFGKNIKYAYVKKYDKLKLRYHYHIVVNIDYIGIDEFKDIWKHGFSQISKIENVNHVATYMANNIKDKDIENNKSNIKFFNKSRNCKNPEWVYGFDAEEILLDAQYKTNNNPKFIKNYNSDYVGEMTIITYEI